MSKRDVTHTVSRALLADPATWMSWSPDHLLEILEHLHFYWCQGGRTSPTYTHLQGLFQLTSFASGSFSGT